MDRSSLFKLKILITSIILLFILQEIVVHKYIAEPYPALRMPPFSGNGMNEDGLYQSTSIDIEIKFEEGEKLLLTKKEFFYDAPISHHWSLAKKFKPTHKTERPLPYQQYEFLKPIIPGFFVSRQRSIYEVQHHPETIEWLTKQISEISRQKSPEKISFIWYKDTYHPDSLLSRQRNLTDTTTISL